MLELQMEVVREFPGLPCLAVSASNSHGILEAIDLLLYKAEHDKGGPEFLRV